MNNVVCKKEGDHWIGSTTRLLKHFFNKFLHQFNPTYEPNHTQLIENFLRPWSSHPSSSINLLNLSRLKKSTNFCFSLQSHLLCNKIWSSMGVLMVRAIITKMGHLLIFGNWIFPPKSNCSYGELFTKACQSFQNLVRFTCKLALCLLCQDQEETIHHLLMECSFTKTVWFGGKLGSHGGSNAWSDEDKFNVIATIWVIWKHRFEVLFRHAQPHLDTVFRQINLEISQWQDAQQYIHAKMTRTVVRNLYMVPNIQGGSTNIIMLSI